MFQNPVYRGDTANCKKRVVSYKNLKQVKVPMEDWVIVEDTHTAIISREDWQKCYDMITTLGRVRRTKESEILPFTGLLVCKDCGYKMRHNHSYYKVKSGEKRRHDSYNCSTYTTTGKGTCASHYISVKELNEIVCRDIRKKAGEVVCDEQAIRQRYFGLKAQSDTGQFNADTTVLKQVQKRLKEIEKLIQSTFEKSVLTTVSAETLANLIRKYETEKSDLTEKARVLSNRIATQSQSKNDVEMFIRLMKECVNITELDRATAVELIDKIVVSAKSVEPREFVIYYNFVGNVDD